MGRTLTPRGGKSQWQVILDLGGSGRDAPFTGVIFKDDAVKFPSVSVLSGKVVDIRGRIKEYRGKPEIILNNAGQLTPK